MSEITLEKVDKIRERTGVTYAEAKHALEVNDGDVLEALVYIETVKNNGNESKKTWESEEDENKNISFEDFKSWLGELIRKGNVARIKIKKEDKILVDIPVNAGVAAGVLAVFMPQLLAIGLITAIATKITVEITKADGSVEVVNKMVVGTAETVKDKATDIASTVIEKFNSVKNDVFHKGEGKKIHTDGDTPVYTYTVKFDEVDKE